MMKVLVIVTAHFGYDGISNVATNYYLYQNHKKVQMDLLTINEIPTFLKQEMAKNGDRHYILNFRNSNPLKYIINLSRLIKANQYDVVHIHGNSNTMAVDLCAALFAGCKTRIAHCHTTKSDHPFINRLLRPLFKRVYTDAFACSVEAGEWLFRKGEATIIANGIDLQRFTLNEAFRTQYKKELGLENRLVIGHVGRFSAEKNHQKLLSIYDAVRQVNPNVTLLMWGDGELLEEVREQAKRMGGDIRLMGTSHEIEKCLHAIDVIVFPSLYEGLPLILIEAQAIGIPCLLSNTVPPMAQITPAVYYTDLHASDQEWANETMRIASLSKVEDNARTSHALIRAAGYDIRMKADQLLDIYNQLIQKNHG